MTTPRTTVDITRKGKTLTVDALIPLVVKGYIVVAGIPFKGRYSYAVVHRPSGRIIGPTFLRAIHAMDEATIIANMTYQYGSNPIVFTIKKFDHMLKSLPNKVASYITERINLLNSQPLPPSPPPLPAAPPPHL